MSRPFGINRFHLCAAIALALIWPADVHAQRRFRVSSPADAVDALPGDGICATSTGECTLRAAVQETNALGGADIIRVPAGRFTLALQGGNEDLAASGDLDILDNLRIVGSGADRTVISASGLGDRVFHVSPGGAAITVALTNLTVRDGFFRGPIGQFSSGGGLANAGRLELVRVVVAENSSDSSGGGIFNSGVLTVRNCELTLNHAGATVSSGRGGAIHNVGSADIRSSLLTQNDATTRGGAILNDAGGILSISDTRITSNLAGATQGLGGGLYNAGVLHVSRTTISGNGGGDFTSGIGIANAGSLTLVNSTLSGNRAFFGTGGGLFSTGSALVIASTLVANESAFQGCCVLGSGGVFAGGGTIVLSHTIVAGNRDRPLGGTFRDCATDADGQIVSRGYNIFGLAAGCSADGAFDQEHDPAAVFVTLLSPLGNNGGPTPTHALLAGSPAIDAGDPAGCRDERGRRLRVDQRGLRRPRDGSGTGSAVCDIGAFERQPSDVP
jgi:hypothetical protein